MLPTLSHITAIPKSTPEKELVMTGRQHSAGWRGGDTARRCPHTEESYEQCPNSKCRSSRKSSTSLFLVRKASPRVGAPPAWPGRKSRTGLGRDGLPSLWIYGHFQPDRACAKHFTCISILFNPHHNHIRRVELFPLFYRKGR